MSSSVPWVLTFHNFGWKFSSLMKSHCLQSFTWLLLAVLLVPYPGEPPFSTLNSMPGIFFLMIFPLGTLWFQYFPLKKWFYAHRVFFMCLSVMNWPHKCWFMSRHFLLYYWSSFILVAHCPNYYSFVIQCEIRWYNAPNLFDFSQNCFRFFFWVYYGLVSWEF